MGPKVLVGVVVFLIIFIVLMLVILCSFGEGFEYCVIVRPLVDVIKLLMSPAG